ncbi:phage tail tape measure protein [Pseudomonas tolaasii]|uniref:phage tail tape measure protein n=1 Tax=Pseudomonas tolaasii TaxID=29442 RepID=UPI00214C20E0|nr:phage tail tape measure protein [Pseudomonas tolaasii]
MQDKYSLAYGTARDGQELVGKEAAILRSGALAAERSGEAAAAESTNLALSHAGLELSGLSLSLGLLRRSVEALHSSLSGFKTVDLNPPRTNGQADQSNSTVFKSSKVDDRRVTREALTIRNIERLDPVAAFQQSNASLTFGSKLPPEKSTTVLREESTQSAERLAKTLETAPVLLEPTWLEAKTAVMNSANSWAGDSAGAATTVKTAEAVILPVLSPVFTQFFSGLGDTIKSRVTGNVVDLTLGKLPGGVGKLFKSDGFKEEKSCCCANAAQKPLGDGRSGRKGSSGARKNAAGSKSQRNQRAQKKQRSQNPQKPHTAQKKPPLASAPPSTPRAPAKTGGRLATWRESIGRGVQSLFPAYSLGFNAGAPIQRIQPGTAQASSLSANTASPARGSSRGPGLIEALAREQALMPAESRVKAQPYSPPLSHERPAAPVNHPPNIPAAGLVGAMSKLESVGARRLGPMRYVDTAMDVVQGIRNGDVNAIGSGLSSAGGAWAGASAGAAIGTMIFPGVGTAVGGAIGGLLGSEAGSWLGDKLFGPSDRLPAPADVSKNLNNAQADNRQVNFAPQITINAPEQASYQQLAQLVVQQIEAQFSPLSMDDLLGSRRDAALTDIGGV